MLNTEFYDYRKADDGNNEQSILQIIFKSEIRALRFLEELPDGDRLEILGTAIKFFKQWELIIIEHDEYQLRQ